LDETESLMRMMISRHKEQVKQRTEEARIARSEISRIAPESVGNETPPVALALDELEYDLKVEFDRRLRRKADAVAERRRLAVILVNGRPVSSKAIDVTEDFF